MFGCERLIFMGEIVMTNKKLVILEGQKVLAPFSAHEWLRQNFSLQYLYNIKYASNENKEKYQLRNY